MRNLMGAAVAARQSVALLVGGLSALVSLAACGVGKTPDDSRLLSSGQPLGQLRGHFAVSQTFRDFVFNSPSFTYAGVLGSGSEQSLRVLLGAWQSNGTESRYENGVPNAINMFLYQNINNRVAFGLREACSQEAVGIGGMILPLHGEFSAVAQGFCQASNEEEAASAAQEIWYLLVGYERPEDGAEVYRLYRAALSQGDVATTPEDRLELYLGSVLSHPSFLLKY